tara:strand:+ start:948 stop:1949 length:1002 start_codon:yes stop_codon:yes gene_type:complete
MIQLRYIIFFVVLLILSHFYNKIKSEESKNTNEYYFKMIDKYLLTPESLGKNNKPCLWIHIHNDNTIIPSVNQRKWLNFNSRNTTNLNQPYQYITLKTIIDNNSEDFNICMIDDNSFKKIIPDWNLDVEKMSNPIKTHMRNIALSRILNIYGGLLVPSSFICNSNLKSLWNDVKNSKTFTVGEFIDRSVNSNLIQQSTCPSILLMASTSNNKELNDFIKYQEILLSENQSSEIEFNALLSNWLQDNINKNTIQLIDGKFIGTKDFNNKPVIIDNLMSNETINFIDDKYGIYIAWDELLLRTYHQWFAYLSVDEVLNCNNNLGNLILLAVSEKN